MFQIPSDWEVERLCFFASFLTSFSVVAGALSSDIDKPATAESTRVSSADMMGSVEEISDEVADGWGKMEGEEGEESGEDEKKRGRAGDQARRGCKSWMSLSLYTSLSTPPFMHQSPDRSSSFYRPSLLSFTPLYLLHLINVLLYCCPAPPDHTSN